MTTSKEDILTIVSIVGGVFVLIVILIYAFKGFNSSLDPGDCSFSIMITQPVGQDDYGTIMSDGSIWGSYTENMIINHTYAYAKCDTYDGSCVCPKGTTGPYIIKEIS